MVENAIMRSPLRSLQPPLLLTEYYDSADVRNAILEYSGATVNAPPTAVYLVGLYPGDAMPAWDRNPIRVDPTKLQVPTAFGCDIARSLWDRMHLIFLIELERFSRACPRQVSLLSLLIGKKAGN